MLRIRRAAAVLLAGASLALSASAQTPITTVLYTDDVVRPLQIHAAPGDNTRLFVLEQHQHDIEIFIDGVKNGTPYLDLDTLGVGVTNSNEQGLLGFAFHPDYATNGYVFINYTASGGGTTKIRRYTRSANPNFAASGVEILSISQPQSNHNGGTLQFGPFDDALYIATGDGGSGNDPHGAIGNGQSLTTLLGKILRVAPNLDASPSAPFVTGYVDNPFFGQGGTQNLIWQYGLRNPFSFFLDAETGDMWIGDVGQDPFSAVGREEMNWADASNGGGENFGWRCMEGSFSTGLSGCTPFSPGLELPISQHTWGSGANQGRAIIGGPVYRGDKIPDLQGTVFYSDNSSSNLWSLDDGPTTSSPTVRNSDLAPAVGGPISQPSGWGVDHEGEIYISAIGGGGKIFKIVPDTAFEGLGCSTNGTYGAPVLWGSGSLVVGTSGSLNLTNALENRLTLLLVSAAPGSIPFYGGTLKAGVPWLGEFYLNTNASGNISLPWASWPSGVPSGTELYFHWAIDDPAGIGGVALSNAIKGTQP